MGRLTSDMKPSSPQSDAAAEVNRLIVRKEDIEAEMEGHKGRLMAEKSTMNSSLVTLDGFPRDDIDVLAVRTARVRLIELRNDLKSVMDQIEAALHNALPPSDSSLLARPVDIMNGGVEESDHPSSDMPFAVVKSIDPNGPAGAAGLAADDRIVSFGSVNASNHENLRALAALVGKSEGTPISIDVLRQGQLKSLTMVPKSDWGGRGLIGTHIVPI